MELADLLLKREELPITHETRFLVPIHPKLLSPEIKLDENLAYTMFEQAANDWYEDLKVYRDALPDGDEKKWLDRVFLKAKPVVRDIRGRLTVTPLDFWEALVNTTETGFARAISISRDAGGTLYLDGDDPREFAIPGLVRFPPEKLKEYQHPKSEGCIYSYRQHNVDHAPGAIFLRDWAILYLNEALKSIHK